ncbi:60S ribosomal protein L31B [Sorochytrium milnesiophthora]
MVKTVAKSTKSSTKAPKRSTLQDVVTREYTIHLHKEVHGVQFKKRTPQAIKAIKKFALRQMGTTDVRIDPTLNKALWSTGVRNVGRRVRVRISRKRNDEEGAKEKLYSYVQWVPVETFKGLETVTVGEQE